MRYLVVINVKTKYPIVLVHGVALKDLKFIKSFGEIDRILKIQGYSVYKANIDGFGSVMSNAIELKEYILKILEIENVSKVNIIAHSKGGLDSKYMIKNLDMEDCVASLTTLCTPHKGSPIASKLLKLPKWLIKFIAFWINFWYRLFGDKHPDAYQACLDLQRINSLEEETINFSDKVYCQSFSTEMKKSKDDFIMGIPLMFSKYFEKDLSSDGLVPVDSTIFGEYRGNAFNESVSHSEIVDFMVKKKKKDKIYMFYSTLCEELVNMGF
jgi:triacylglycerol lipase